MRWVVYLLGVTNALVFSAFLFVSVPSDGFRLVDPVPLSKQGQAASILLLKENSIGETGEESVGNVSALAVGAMNDSIRGESTEEKVPQSPKCYKLGPFSSTVDADLFHARIGVGNDAWLVDSEINEGNKLYWTYIPPSDTKDAALAMLRSLQMQGIDSFVLSSGDNVNAISLGTFKKHDSAEALKNRVAELGFDARVTTKPEVKPVYWLYLQAGALVDQMKIEATAEDGIQARVFSCEIFAQGKLLP
jgi:hypothetical protein